MLIFRKILRTYYINEWPQIWRNDMYMVKLEVHFYTSFLYLPHFFREYKNETLTWNVLNLMAGCVRVCVFVRMCVYVCVWGARARVCVCVCVYSFHRKGFSWLNKTNVMPETRSAMMCWGIYSVSSTFVAMS